MSPSRIFPDAESIRAACRAEQVEEDGVLVWRATVSNGVAARDAGASEPTVIKAKKRFGVRPFTGQRKRLPRPETIDQYRRACDAVQIKDASGRLVWKARRCDKKAAAILGVTYWAVTQARARYGILSAQREPVGRFDAASIRRACEATLSDGVWQAALTDEEAARRAGVSASSLGGNRRRFGVLPLHPRSPPSKVAAAEVPYSVIHAACLAVQVEENGEVVWRANLLDREAAPHLGISPSGFGAARRRADIRPCCARPRATGPRSFRLDEARELLKRMSVAQAASQLGVAPGRLYAHGLARRRVGLLCSECGERLPPRRQLVCSQVCNMRRHRRIHSGRGHAVCTMCGTSLEGRRPDARVCSRRCESRLRRLGKTSRKEKKT